MTDKTYPHVMSLVFNTPLAILPSKLEDIAAFLELRQMGVKLSAEQIHEQFGPPSTMSPNEAQGAVSVLNLFGVVSQRMNALENASGGTSTEQFGAAFDAAVNDSSVSAIVINVDSPGGAVTGTEELSDKIYKARGVKPIIAVANSLMASAAYWIASAADEIVATPSSETGSIGVLSIHTDTSVAHAEAGITHTVFRSTEHKAEGMGFEPLSESAAAHRQGRVSQVHTKFVAAVARNRDVSIETVEANFGKGRTLFALEAEAVGMVDRVGTLENVLESLGVGADLHSSGADLHRPAFDLKGYDMDSPVLEALVKRDLVSLDTKEDAAQLVLQAFFAAKGEAVPETTEAIVDGLKLPDGKTVKLSPTVADSAQTSTVGADDIVAMVNISALGDADKMTLVGELVGKKLTTPQVLDAINKANVTDDVPPGATVKVTKDETDKLYVAGRDAILCNTWSDAPETIYDKKTDEDIAWNPRDGRKNYRMQSLLGLAKACIENAGGAHLLNTMSNSDVARLVSGVPLENFSGTIQAGSMFNVSGNFSNILLDASNVLLRRSYTEANTTFQVWMKQSPSLPDFKQVHKVIAGEIADPQAIPEDGEFFESTISDSKEAYKLTVWGSRFSVSWQTIVNDQLGAFTEIPVKQGRSMRRKQNKLAYSVLNDNPTLTATNAALFNNTAQSAGGHNNIIASQAAPTVAALDAGYAQMAIQSGLRTETPGDVMLNLEASWLIVPPALRGTSEILLASKTNPDQTNSGVVNNWQNGLSLVVDPQISATGGGANDTWYTATNHADVDTIEFAYLQGLESPALESETSFDRLGFAFRIYQAFAVKAIDYRGLQQYNA